MTQDIERYRKVVDGAKDLPALTPVVKKLIEMIKNPSASATDVGELISKDVALCATTLKLVNSPFYGLSQKVDRVTHAIVIMGFGRVKNIVLGISVLETLKSQRGVNFDFTGLWEHAIATAIAAEALATRIGSAYVDEAFVAGLLHDQGKLILFKQFPVEFAHVQRLIDQREMLMQEAELEVLGINHALIGTWLAEKWKFPEHLTAAIRMHHNPSMARQHRELVWLVHAGDVFARSLGVGNGGDPFVPAFDPQVWEQLRLTPEVVDNVFGDTLNGIAKAGDFFELVRA